MGFLSRLGSASHEPIEGRDQPLLTNPIHLVLGTSMTEPFPNNVAQLIVGMGCFWGAERLFWELNGVHTTAVGYSGGTTKNPTWHEACTGRTGHTEAVLVVSDPAVVTVEELLKVFWENHDPTQKDRQGNDRGPHYRSALYASSPEQLAVFEASADKYQKRLTSAGYGQIQTEIALAGPFYYAEQAHQQYLARNPQGYCNHGFCQAAYDEH